MALGQELSLRGHAATFATASHYRELIERHGIAFTPIRPEAPMDDRAAMAKIMDARRGPETVIKDHVMPGRLVWGERGAAHAAEVLVRRFA
jgi:UDP:flavonoid glycosyltransferase YjiC (YdhE family)